MNKEEKKQKHLRELNTARVRRFLNKHPMKHFDVLLKLERYNEIDTALKKAGITKKQFIENAIDDFLKY